MRNGAFFVAGGAALVGALVSHDAHAVGTRTFELDTLERLSGGDLKGVTIGSDGVVRAGWTLGNVPFPEGAGTTTTCAVELADGSVLVGTGPGSGGKVVRIAGHTATVFADTHETAVNAIAVDKTGAVFAATTSNKIYKVSQGKAEVFATLHDVDGVFALAADRRTGALYAGTGDEGKVMRVEPGTASTVYFKTDGPFVVSLAVADDGAVYAGTGGKGLLYRITAAGHATVLYDFHGEDVHAVAIAPDHTLWAIANEGAASTTETTESSSRRTTGGRTPPGPSTIPRIKVGKGSLWHFDAQGRPERVMHHDEFHYLSLALDDKGTPYVGTGAEGRVYTADDAHRVSLVADTDERQIGALVVSGAVRFFVGSDPASFHDVLAVGGQDAVWTSKALDAGLRARFGHMRWTGAGSLQVTTRTGDTQTPDTTWSRWSEPVADGGPIGSPEGRFIQVRAKLLDAGATIADVSVPFVTKNLRAVVTEVAARQKGSHESRDSKESKEKDGVPASGNELPRHDAVVHVTWKVDNPDNDDLRYRVSFHRDGQTRWLDATTPDEVLTRSELDWDTSSLPEGKYRVRVDASDELANPPSDTMHFALETSQVLVDNTPPVIKTLTAQLHRLHVEVVDGLGPIARVEVAIDGRTEWRPLAPVDGIFDTADETVDTDLTLLLLPTPGPHVIAVRAYDAAGNFVVREVEGQ